MAIRAWDEREPAVQGSRMSKYIRYGVLAVLSVIGIAVLMASWYTVPEGYVAVIVRNGAVIGEAKPGLNFKVPMIDQAYDMSVQTRRVNFEDVAAYSKDIQQATSYVTVNSRLDPAFVLKTYTTVGLGYESVLLNARVFKHLKEKMGKHQAIDIINNRDLVSNEVEDALREDMAQFGIIVEDVQIANIDFSDTYEHAAEEAQVAKAAVTKAQQELERAKVETQKLIATADAEAKSTKLSADAQAYKIEAEAKAEAASISAKGQALAANPLVLELTRIQRWQGQVPSTMLPDASVPMISLK
jgi:regulator of protease activity HflC (stomatin/prohibitin superfamily)